MDKNECKLNCSQATSNCRQLLLSQVTCFIYKDMWATMLLSELKKKESGGELHALASSESSWECLNGSLKNVPAFKYANEGESDTSVDNSV